MTDDEQAVLAVNARFYEAFEASDMTALAATWEHSDRAICTHPGWATIRGWSGIAESWEAIMRGGGPPQFILTAEQVTVVGDAAWVTLDENLIGQGRDLSRRVKRWRDARMIVRWLATACIEAEKRFHRVRDHQGLATLVAALRGDDHAAVADEAQAA